jgi:hypothetical protein
VRPIVALDEPSARDARSALEQAMTSLKRALLLAAFAAFGCGTPQATSTATRAVTSSEAVPAPAVSHALNNAPPNAPSTAEHHSDAPSPGPAVDPATAASVIDPVTSVPAAVVREVTIPAGTTLNLRLATAVSSNGSRVEDAVQATLSRPVVIKGMTVIPAGAAVTGYVTEAAASGRVKGRARVGVRFSAVRVGNNRYTIRTSAVTREAPGTKKVDAAKIGIGAGAGAIVGAVAGGKKGAAVGTAVGAAGGTGVVLATRGQEVALARGSVVTPRLSEPVTIRIH